MKQQTDTVPAASAAPTPNGSAPASTNGATHAGNFSRVGEPVVQLPLDRCIVAEFNTRHPEPKDVRELALSLKSTGQTTPAIVRPHPKKKDCFEIGAGSRRLVACREAGIPTLAAIVRSYDDASFEELILVENMQREGPDPKAEVELLDRLVKRGVSSAEQISEHLGKPKHWAIRRLQLLKVIPELRKRWTQNSNRGSLIHYSVEMMSLLGSLPADTQRQLEAELKTYGRSIDGCTSRADLQKYLNSHVLCRLDTAGFDLNDPKTFVPGCGPGCASDSSQLTALFDFGDKKECARCLNVGCFMRRKAIATKNKLAELTKGEDLPLVTNEYRNRGELQVGDRKLQVDDIRYHGIPLEAKESKGAQKVVVVDEQDNLRIAYMPKRTSSSSGKKVKAPGAALSERKNILQGRRLVAVHAELAKALEQSKHADCTEDVIDLVAIFGLPFHAEGWYSTKVWQAFDSRKKNGYPLLPSSKYVPAYMRTASRAPKEKESDPSRDAALWAGLKSVFGDCIRPGGKTGDYVKKEPELRRVAKLIKFDFDAAKRKADETLRPPKTWGAVDIHTLEPVKVVKELKPKTQCEQALDAKEQRGEEPAFEAAVWLDNERRGATKLTPQARARCRAILAALPSARRKQIIKAAKSPKAKVGGASAARPTPSSRRKEGPRKPSPAKPQKTAAKKTKASRK